MYRLQFDAEDFYDEGIEYYDLLGDKGERIGLIYIKIDRDAETIGFANAGDMRKLILDRDKVYQMILDMADFLEIKGFKITNPSCGYRVNQEFAEYNGGNII